jgi:hypothetical protein
MTAANRPVDVYRARLAEREGQLVRLDRQDRWLSIARMIVVLAGLVIAWAIFDPDRLALAWILLPLAVFAALAVIHDGVARRRTVADRAARFYRAGIDRIEDRWVGQGATGERFADPDHPCAADLDLFGKGSLYQLLCRARTSVGQHRLASWLLTPADPATARARQGAVGELAADLQLREELAMLAGAAAPHLRAEHLADWASRPPVLPPAWRWVPAIAAVATLISFAGWATGLLPRAAPMLAVLFQGIVAAQLRGRVHEVVATVDRAGGELELLSGVLATIENRRFDDPLLEHSVAALRSAGAAPSTLVARLRRLIVLLDSRRNQMFAPVAALLLWTTQLAFAIEGWRRRHGKAVARWLDAVGEFEALASLAGYRYEHPEDACPEILDEGPLFDAHQVGHPLLPAGACVRNDLTIDADSRLLIVSGSNMSGKSTLMRTVGINAVLAQAGAPVRAASLRLSPFRVGASIRLQDSLRKGMSGFYAEIHRLRELVDMAGGSPQLLFLLEELLSTTNSHDRRIGARAILASLLERGAVGMVTTHDLAITRLDEELPTVRNVHFEDHIEGGEVRFDYRLRDGVVERSNAVELMRSIGLDV